MSITATELKENLSKYLLMAATEDIVITRNGKAVARLGSPYPDRVANAKSLAGIISSELNYEELKKERLERK